MPYIFACQVWLRNSKGVTLIGGLELGWVGFWFRDAIFRKQCEIELRWQLITNRKSYMSFRLQQKSMTLNDLKRQFTALWSVLCVLRPNGWIKLESSGFYYKVALYHSYLLIKFDDDIRGGPLIWGSQNRVGGFQLCGTIFWRRCEIKLR